MVLTRYRIDSTHRITKASLLILTRDRLEIL
uniref:Uncharacterized protein n=1 Tax=virus sp. ctBM815 TaxID=2825806 RepID=A0A8S5RKS5_9VIRU|nr:MAG TPA: hypothetical protein [virus sp. ctBM815]DAG45337.1 MAG TPA: hypothetical protein [Caudoviricetes sp.]